MLAISLIFIIFVANLYSLLMLHIYTTIISYYILLLYTITFTTASFNIVTYCLFMIYTSEVHCIEWTKCATNISKPDIFTHLIRLNSQFVDNKLQVKSTNLIYGICAKSTEIVVTVERK